LVDVLVGGGGDLAAIPGLSWRAPRGWRHNLDGELLALDSLPLPRREARAWDGAFYFDRTFDVAETSRGCPLPCTFCSIRRMYGRTFRRFPIGRVIADLRALDPRGARGVFFVDDHITIDAPRVKALCGFSRRTGSRPSAASSSAIRTTTAGRWRGRSATPAGSDSTSRSCSA